MRRRPIRSVTTLVAKNVAAIRGDLDDLYPPLRAATACANPSTGTKTKLTAMLAGRSTPAGAQLQKVCNVTEDACRGACYAGMRQAPDVRLAASARATCHNADVPSGQGLARGSHRARNTANER